MDTSEFQEVHITPDKRAPFSIDQACLLLEDTILKRPRGHKTTTNLPSRISVSKDLKKPPPSKEALINSLIDMNFGRRLRGSHDFALGIELLVEKLYGQHRGLGVENILDLLLRLQGKEQKEQDKVSFKNLPIARRLLESHLSRRNLQGGPKYHMKESRVDILDSMYSERACLQKDAFTISKGFSLILLLVFVIY